MSRPAMHMTPKTTDYRTVDLAWLRRKGARHVGYSGKITWRSRGEVTGSIGYRLEPGGLRLIYRNTPYAGVPEDINDLIPIITTRMHFGGVRHWFSCPSCWRGCRILYGGARFRCRLCRGARYESQYQAAALTACDRRWDIRRRLEERGGFAMGLFGLDDGLPPKPKGMHWRTYRRLEQLDEHLADRWCVGMAGLLQRLGRTKGRR
jgi:hypothetical protein